MANNLTILGALNKTVLATKSYIDGKLAEKVDKEAGKGLSTNDLTDALKLNYDAAYDHSQTNHFSGLYSDLTEKPDLSIYAPKDNPVFTTAISMGRKADTTVGANSVALGYKVTANNYDSHAEGWGTTASGYASHAEGYGAIASGDSSHAEGGWTTASGADSHAEGFRTIASGVASHAEGWGTTASGYASHAQGKYNIEDSAGTYAHIVGNGISETTRSNAHTLDWNGNAWYQGKVTVGADPTEDMDLTTKKYVDDKVAGIVDSAPETLDTLKELSAALGNDANFATTVANQIGNKVDKVEGKGLSTNDLTNTLKANYDAAYTHSTSAHAPSNAQKNSDITKSEIEAKLTGNITTHTHNQYLTSHQSLEAYALKTDLHSHTNKTVLDGISSTNISNWNSAYTHSTSSHFSGDYNDLTNKPASLPANGGNADTVDNVHIVQITKTNYNALSTKDSNTLYLITE